MNKLEEEKVSKRESDCINLNFYDEISNNNNPTNSNSDSVKSYISNYKLYGLSFQNTGDTNTLRLATSTIETSNSNRIEVIELDKNLNNLSRVSVEDTEFPCSKILWSPSINSNSILATTSDVLRLYKYSESSNKLNLACSLNKKNNQNYSGPLTSMDWNKENPSILGVCSIDTTCTIWDLNKNDIKTLLIAHDKEVYDIAFGKDENIFLSTGADGSIRLFDIRSLDTCSVFFEQQDGTPITRIAWNQNNTNFIAAIVLDKNYIYIIDQRMLNSPYALLTYHTNVVNSIAWAPNSNSFICSVGDDKNSLIWDIQLISNKTEDPVMCYTAETEIDNVCWSDSNSSWVGITGGNTLQLLGMN